MAMGVDERAWAAIRLAADLRALDRPCEALSVLEVIATWDLPERIERALYTCAIGAHRDIESLDMAHRLVLEQRARSSDEKFETAASAVEADLARAAAA